MRILLALARAAAALLATVIVLVMVPVPHVSSSTVELVAELGAASGRLLPLEMARHLREAILDRKTVERLAGTEGASDQTMLDAASRLERGVELVTLDGRTYFVVVRDSDGDWAKRVSDELASLVVARASEVVARSCGVPGCSAKARVTESASMVATPLEPERWLVLGLGLLVAIAVAVVPLVVVPAEPGPSRRERGRKSSDEAPATERLPRAVVGGTAPAAAAPAPASREPAERAAAGLARTEVAAGGPAPGGGARAADAASSASSPIMGYGAPPGWRADASLNVRARADLASQILALPGEDCVTLAVCAAPQDTEQKAHIATELALAITSASEEKRVLLVDADFRNPAVATLLGIQVPEAADFTRELARRSEGGGSPVLGVLICTPTLHLLPGNPSASGDLILTTHFEACLRIVRDYYDIVVVNGPLTSAGVYCTAIADVVDGVVGVRDTGVPSALSKKAFVFVAIPVPASI
jgi:Mrp family chromosome partitioning ATPase